MTPTSIPYYPPGARLRIAFDVVVEASGLYSDGFPGVFVASPTWRDMLRGKHVEVVALLTPEEPRPSTVVLDRTGLAWQRINLDEDGSAVWHAIGEEKGFTWEDLYQTFGPVRELWKEE